MEDLQAKVPAWVLHGAQAEVDAGTEAQIPSVPWQAFKPGFCRQGWRGRMQSKGVKHGAARTDVL